ncbi:FAD-binding oxidoreductase [Aspergillus stella-maris]|uniref:FAD-binding oxidoreductase n=1 Tax=Aspergillus stella-maris TaxID=1810926 RepID=UPI003CCE378B
MSDAKTSEDNIPSADLEVQIPSADAGLRRVPDRIPWVVLLIIIVELGERFTYFGLSGPFQNYIKNPYNGDLPGALGKGQAVATALGDFFKFWAYASTVLGAIVADQYLGKFKAIVIACGLYIIGLTVLVATATPASIDSGHAFGGLVASMVIIGVATGGIKANVTPFCAEQYQNTAGFVKTLKTGERVLVDPDLTVERMFLWFYWAVNIGALSPLITTTVETHVGFWLSYLIPLIVIVIVAVLFILSNKLFRKTQPQGSPIVDAARTVHIAILERGFEKAKPSSLQERAKLDNYAFASRPDYTDYSVEKVKTGVTACKLFLLFPLYFICWTQIWNNVISQAGTMALHGTPNDLLQNLDPIALIIFIPLLDFVVYPLLRKYNINFRPELKITAGFFLAALSMVYASVLQYYIYRSPPNSIHVWIQTPIYVLIGFSEAFVVITGLELAYTKAPESLRSLVSALFWLTIGIAAAICIALAPVSQDPYLTWMYGSLGIAGAVGGILFYILFGRAFDETVVVDAIQPTRTIIAGTMARDSIVILGAGIIGLNVALELSKQGYGRHVTIISKYLPGDSNAEYTSPWAGANFSGISGSYPNALRWDRAGYLALMGLIDRGADEAKYLSKTQSTEYWDEPPSADKIGSVTEYLRDVEIVPEESLPENVSFGLRFTTITLNAPAHCLHLRSLLERPEYGSVKFQRRSVTSLNDAFISQNTKVVFNCIGNAARSLPGVQDAKCYPTRGQIVLAKAPQVKENMMRHGKNYETYIIPRPLSDSTVILGGYLQKGDTHGQVRDDETESILQRTGDLFLALKSSETEVLRVAVGFRPSRDGGARVERQEIKAGTVVHNYGAGGTGYQAGMGMARDAVDLVQDVLQSLAQASKLQLASQRVVRVPPTSWLNLPPDPE